jgi:hypothetical protein
LDDTFHGSCGKVPKILSMVLEPISKSTAHYRAKKASTFRLANEPKYRRCTAVDENKLHIMGFLNMWSAVDVDSKGIAGSRIVTWEEQPERSSIPQKSIKNVYQQDVSHSR